MIYNVVVIKNIRIGSFLIQGLSGFDTVTEMVGRCPLSVDRFAIKPPGFFGTPEVFIIPLSNLPVDRKALHLFVLTLTVMISPDWPMRL